MAINVKFDAILGRLRESDVGLVSAASVSIPDPLIVNNLQVTATASINNLYLNNAYISTATIGNLTTNNIYNASTISTNLINTTRVDFNTSYVANGEPIGSLYWNSDRDTVALSTNGGEIDLGEDLMFYAVNQTGSTINKGTVVQFAGALGSSGKMLIAPAIADGSVPAIQILGITKENITDGDEGKVIMVGELGGINTSVYGTAGTILYIDPSVAGGLTNIEPTAPNLRYPIAATLDSKSNGNLIIRAIFNPNLRDLNDVNFTSLASGNLMLSNASGVWFNYSASSLINGLVNFPSLGSLAVLNDLSYTSLLNLPSLGSLAVLNDLSYTSLLNLPSLGSLAVLNDLSYTSLLNLPSLGSLAVMNQLSFTSLTNQPSLSSLAFQSTIDYTSAQLTNKPSLGSLAVMNQLSFTSLTNQPSLSSLAFQSTIDYTSAQLTNKPSLGSLAQISDVVSPLVLSGATLSISQASIVHNNLGSLQGGTAGEYNHLTNAQVTNLNNQSGTNTGDITVTDSSTIDFTLTGQSLTASTKDSGIQHNALIGLTTGDVHTQYALLAGRSGGQALHGSNLANELLILRGTSANGNTAENNAIRFGVGNGGGTYVLNLKHNGDLSHSGNFSTSGTLTASSFGTILLGQGYLNVNELNNVPPIALADGDILAGSSTSSFQYDSAGNLYFDRYSDTPTTTPQMFFRKARGTASSKTAITAGDDIGYIRAYSYDGTTFDEVTRIQFETVTVQNSGVISFHTSNAGGAIAQRVTIREDGDVGIGTAGPTAKLHIDQASTTVAIPVLTLDQADLSEEFINFVATVGATNPIQTATVLPVSPSHRVRVAVNGTVRFIYLYAT
jgi:hypothetical protein